MARGYDYTRRSEKENSTKSMKLLTCSFTILFSFLLLLYIFSSTFEASEAGSILFLRQIDPCKGRYIYMYELPTEFNTALLRDCRSLIKWFDICPYVVNNGLGPRLQGSTSIKIPWEGGGWYNTNQFLLEVIFHQRMKGYKCLTNVSEKASAVFVPFYAGLEAGRYLWENNVSLRDQVPNKVMEWVKGRREWRRMWGGDHFVVVGRIFWDFIRESDDDSQWGNKLLRLPESKNMSFLGIESVKNPEIKNDISIPYPTYFHPSSKADLLQWQKQLRRKRSHLFSFVGGPRPEMAATVRSQIISQCIAAGDECKLVLCTNTPNVCDNPSAVISTFLSSTFCLQPTGDSITRRSIFDSILAGCIPVFFHKEYFTSGQYPWHLPRNHSLYSVFLPATELITGRLNITNELKSIWDSRVMDLREEVIRLVPAIVYADPDSYLDDFEDAFDIAVNMVLHRVQEKRMLESP